MAEAKRGTAPCCVEISVSTFPNLQRLARSSVMIAGFDWFDVSLLDMVDLKFGELPASMI